jgi:hypothetical protein
MSADDSVPPSFGSGGIPPQQVPGAGYAPPAPGAWVLPPPRPVGDDPGLALRVVAVVLFGLNALANVVGLFGRDSPWNNPVDEVSIAAFVLASVLTAALLLPWRTRDFAAGFALGQALTETARFISSVRPSYFSLYTWPDKIGNVGSYALTALAGIAVAAALVVERRRAVRGERHPIPTLALGIPAAVLAVLGMVVADYKWVFEGDSSPYPCCSWSRSDGYIKTAYVLTAVAIVACLLLALLVSRPGFAKGVLGGVAVFQAIGTAIALIETVAATQSSFGYGRAAVAEQITGHPDAGLWFALASTVLFAIGFAVQGIGRQAVVPGVAGGGYTGPPAPYPQPLYPQPGYPQPGYPQAGDAQPGFPPPGPDSDGGSAEPHP